ncbi:hypothetical protein HZA73_06625 [candidate division TA06 bacterium]|nr:hypothetical protein [candidate division TA06 bacterium]
MHLNPSILQILAPAYKPCTGFQNSCTEMRWQPENGHVPRGFAGAGGELDEIELILVFAEPGNPHEQEIHSDMNTAYEYATKCFKQGKDQFHQNVRTILDMCWRDLDFDHQMRKTWLTDSVLCSAKIECGGISSSASRECIKNYLMPQLALLPNALVVALGNKAQNRLKTTGYFNFRSAVAAAPPGCNRRNAYASWEQIAIEIKRRRSKCV